MKVESSGGEVEMTKREQLALGDATAYHEAGHAWVMYWHFVRKGWCRGVRIDIEPPEDALGLKPDEFPMPPLCGVAIARGLREPELWYWPNHTAWSAAGSVAEGLFAVQKGIWSWSKWEAHCRSSYEEEIAELVEWPDEASNFGDLGGWFRLGCEYDLPVAFDDYWRGWEEAERIVRDDWNTVEALALAAISKKRLSESEVLAICETGEGRR